MSKRVNAWERFIDSLSTSGGQMVFWFGILWTGFAFEMFGIPYGHEIQISAVTGLGISIKGAVQSNQARMDKYKDAPADSVLPKPEE